MNEQLISRWIEKKTYIFVYTTKVRLRGVITHLDENSITIDGRTIVSFNYIVSISDLPENN